MARSLAVLLLALAAGAQAIREPDVTVLSSRTLKDMADVGSTAAQEKAVAALSTAWLKAMANGSADKMLALYAPDAELLPILDDGPLRSPAKIKDYFTSFLVNVSKVAITQRDVRFLNDQTALESGIYDITFKDGSKDTPRYTIVYRQQADGKWKISLHHDSKLPKPEWPIPPPRKENGTRMAVTVPTTKTAVNKVAQEKAILDAFYNWNMTLLKGDAKATAALYTTDTTMLPLRDNINTNGASLEAYFKEVVKSLARTVFYQTKVQLFGPDAGAYTSLFTITTKDGTRVPGRSSFVFVKRGGKWLIVSHHSNALLSKSN